jgi:hypothetical protein
MATTIDTTTPPSGANAADLGAWLKAAIAGGYVAHPPLATYTVTSPIVIYVNSTIQGPLGIDLGGATIVSQITDGSPVIQVVVGPGVDLRYLTFSNFTLQGNGREGDGIKLVAGANDRWLYNFAVDNVTIDNVGGYGLNVQGSVFEGLVSNSWMTNNAKGGAYFGHLADGQVSALRWFGGGFEDNGGTGLTLGNGARDISVDGASFAHNNGMGISAEWGITSVSSSTFTDNKGPGVWFQNYGNFHNDTFTSTGVQTVGVTGWLNGGATLTGSTSTGSPLANLQGYGSAFLTGDSGQVTTGANIVVGGAGGGNATSVSVSTQGLALPALAAVTAATTAAAANSTGTGALETALDAAIAGGTVAHLNNASYTVTAPIIINITSSTQGPIGIDLGGAKILSQITGGGPVIEIIVAPGVNVGELTLSNFMILGSGSDGDGIKIIADGTNRSIQNLTISNVNIEHVGGIGLDVIGNVAHGTVFNSWMHGNLGGGARFANSAGGGTVSDVDWIGGGFRKNGVAGLILDNGAKDVSVKGAYFVENYGPGIHATSGITLVQQSGFENNTGAGAIVKGTSAFVDDTFSTHGPQQVGVAGYLTGGAKISLTGDSNEYYGWNADTTVLANVQGTGTLAIAGGGKVLVGPGIGVTGGDASVTPPADIAAPTLSSIAASGAGIIAGSGALDAGDVITLTMTLNEAVTVTGGTPTLVLNDGGTATYTGGSGSATLTFSHTVQAGQNVADLAVSSLVLNGSSIKDAAGNSAFLSAAANYNPAGTLKVDTTAPVVSSITTSGSGITNGGGTLGIGKVVTLTVNASEAVTVTGSPTLTLNDGGTATYSGGSGSSALSFTYTVAAGQNTPDLVVTSLNLNGGSLRDAAGNAVTLSGAANYNPGGILKIDTGTSTAVPVVTAALANDTGSSSTDKVTSNAAISGTADPNAVVRFTIDGNPSAATVTTNAAGIWSFTPTGLAEGGHSIVASEINAGGLTGTSTLTFTLDTAAPTVTADLATMLAVASLGASTGTAFTGSGEANGLVRFTVDANAIAGTTTADSSGLWSYTTGALANGAHTLVASQTDLAGNTGSASVSFNTGITVPPAMTVKLINDTGISAGDGVTAAPALTGTADPNSIVHFTIDGTAVAATATVNAGGVWSYTPTGLSDGQHTVVASATNAGGATGSAALAFTLDTKGTVPVFTGGAMSNGQVTVTGTAEAGSTLSIYDGNNWAGFATAGSDGKFTFATPGDTTVSHSFGAIATDLAGNIGKGGGYVVSPGAPAAPIVTGKLATDTGSSSTDKITSNATLTGTADANSVVHFAVDGTAIAATATANASGAWSYTPTGLADGQHTVVASATNSGGATGSASLSFILDTKGTAPVFTGGVQANNQVTLSGTSEAGSQVSIYDNASWLGFATAGTDGNWSFTGKGLANTVHTYGGLATDLAGNVGKTTGKLILGSSAADTLIGSVSNDTIQGNGGGDKLTGGTGADTFTFRAVAESSAVAADTVTDFVHGIDKIDFTNIAGLSASNQFQGNITGAGNLTLNAHSLAFLEVGGNTVVLANTSNVAETVTTTNTSAADMKIVLLGVNLGLTGTDFHHS